LEPVGCLDAESAILGIAVHGRPKGLDQPHLIDADLLFHFATGTGADILARIAFSFRQIPSTAPINQQDLEAAVTASSQKAAGCGHRLRLHVWVEVEDRLGGKAGGTLGGHAPVDHQDGAPARAARLFETGADHPVCADGRLARGRNGACFLPRRAVKRKHAGLWAGLHGAVRRAVYATDPIRPRFHIEDRHPLLSRPLLMSSDIATGTSLPEMASRYISGQRMEARMSRILVEML